MISRLRRVAATLEEFDPDKPDDQMDLDEVAKADALLVQIVNVLERMTNEAGNQLDAMPERYVFDMTTAALDNLNAAAGAMNDASRGLKQVGRTLGSYGKRISEVNGTPKASGNAEESA